ncbi:AAA domain-containing protein [Saccharothrix violaceirubra]|uniref:Putative nucleic acid-binding protein n=1 Tax=Saccharothrix violaceirubra TaxID=413306 RepID=A0A7W7T2J4_9PSEU|nr:AAA domain-containing protein [Saccharothrix violaceirubra]MBB4965422.1 putative nucleic acid-binding protein [Saccharothrix violaceirubra]
MSAEAVGDQPEVAELLRAVRAEIDATLGAETGFDKVVLTEGRVVGGGGDRHEYSFAARGWKDSSAARPLLIRARPRTAWESAELVVAERGRLRLRTSAVLGAKAELREDDTSGLVALAEQLDRTISGAGGLNLTAAGWLVGRDLPAAGRCPHPERYVRGWRSLQLNDRQRDAVARALGSDLTFVWGPPGTGKTEVVGHVVEGNHRQGHRVLFLAPTNVAVDQAVERLCELLSAEDGFAGGLVQRAGDIAPGSLKEKYGDRIEQRKIVARLSAGLTAEIGELRERLDVVDSRLALHREHAELLGSLEQLRGDARRATRDVATAAAECERARQEAARLRAELIAIGVPTGPSAARKARQQEELLSRLQVVDQDVADLVARHLLATAEQRRHAARVQAAERKASALRTTLVGSADQLATTAKNLRERLEDRQDKLRAVEVEVRGNCRVLATTVAKAVQSRYLIDRFDTVVLDEAGMVALPAAWYAAALARKRVVVAGDFRQLPAVTRASGDHDADPATRAHSAHWMDRDAFHAAGLVDGRGRVRPHGCLIGLDTQYRMRPAICAVVNTIAYPDAPLTTGRADGSRLPPSPLLESPLVLVDTATRRSAAQGGPRSNPVHEAVIHELVRGLQYDGVLPARKEDGGPGDRMAVIAPYRDQVGALKGSLAYRFGADYDGVVDTVHRFQGSQRPLVVIDTVAGAGDRVGRFYEGTGLSSATCRLLNVAVSRAQDHLVVVADVDFLSRNLKPHGEAARLVDHLRRHAHHLDVGDLVPFRAADDLAGLDPHELTRPAFFPADEVPRAVAWDFAHARRGIDIYCAFLDADPVERWLAKLTPRIEDGLTVTVHTRPARRSDDERQIARLEAAGCTVVRRERMHEKVVIVDDEVLWHGSLNLLARTGPTDLMMRITDPGACERVRRIVERARAEPGPKAGGRLYLNVPFAENDLARQTAKARWDPKSRRWYVPHDTPRHLVERWL